jgi:hypothetical protein
MWRCAVMRSLDKGDGILVLSELEKAGRLTDLKFSDVVTMELLRGLDPRQTDFVPFLKFLPAFLHWIDADVGGDV